VLFHVMYLLGD